MGTVADFEKSEQDTEPSFANTYYNNGATRRLFRDPDDHLIAGVCSGIANYFDMDVVWIRLAFALIVLAGGTGIILYIILWIVIPKAVTRADRMVMKGEKLNLQGFKKNFEEEMGSIHDNFSNFKQEAKPFVYKTRDFIGDFFYHLGTFFNGAGKVLLKLIGLFILLSCFGGLIFFIVAFVALLGFGQFAPFHDMPYGLLRHHHPEYIYTAGFVVITVPLVSIILLTLKGIFNTGSISRSAGTTILVIWLFAIAVFVYDVTRIAADFSSSASYSETINLKPVKSNTYYLKLNDLKYFTAEDSARLNIKSLAPNMRITDDEDNDFAHYHQRVNLIIEKSDIDQPVLEESYHARGRTYDAALANSRNIKYIFTQQDSLIKFDQRFYPKNEELWHEEEVSLTLKLPMNAKIIIDRELSNIANVNVNECNELNKRDGNKLTEATFIMTDNGLQCKVDTLVTDTVLTKHLSSDSIKKLKK
ncbi:MAG: PspC domain-containing protein [Mucilaginibacter sp.]|nr:PspC domain-containing protein [Mucilaginibacter sp.]